MTEAHGIKETKEALVGVLELALVIAEALKDGVQIGDVSDVFKKITTDPVLKAAIEAAFEKMEEVPDEVKDTSLIEGAELAMITASYTPKFLAIFAKKSEEIPKVEEKPKVPA